MKNQKKSSTWDLEIVGLIAGFLLISCFGVIFLDTEAAPIFMTIVIGMGVIMNSAIAMLKFCRQKTVTGIMFTALSVVLLVIFILRLFVLKS